MAEIQRQLRDIADLASAMRRAYQTTSREMSLDVETTTLMASEIEAIKTLSQLLIRSQNTSQTTKGILEKLQTRVLLLQTNVKLERIKASHFNFGRILGNEESKNYQNFSRIRQNWGSVLSFLTKNIESATANIATSQQDTQDGITVTDELNTLSKSIPAQKIAPAKFDIVNDVLVVAQERSAPEAIDENNVLSARHALIEQGNSILVNLRNSNCDKRLIDVVGVLQDHLVQPTNIIQLGIANISCEAMRGGFREELSDGLAAMLEGHTRAISMYVAQFPDWARFSGNAQMIELNQQDIDQISTAAHSLTQELAQQPTGVDPEVPKVVRYLRELVNSPGQTSKQAAFALLRTLENLVAKVFGYAADFLHETITMTTKGAAKAVSKAIVGSLVTVVLASALSLTPVTTKITESAWMKTATEILQRQLSALTK